MSAFLGQRRTVVFALAVVAFVAGLITGRDLLFTLAYVDGLSQARIFELHRDWGRRHAQELACRAAWDAPSLFPILYGAHAHAQHTGKGVL